MYVQRYLSDYLPFFIFFGSLLILTGLIFFTNFFSYEQKKFLRDNFLFCFILCILTVISDFFVFSSFEKAKVYTAYMGFRWSVIAVPAAYLWGIIAFSGLFTALRAIPFCGKFLQWFVWLLLTVPIRLYYLVTGILPSYTDILNLLYVKLETTFDTVLPVLTPEIIFKACLPCIITIIFMYVLKFFQPKTASKKFQRALAFCMGILIFTGYCIDMRGENLRQDSMTFSVNVLSSTIHNINDYNLHAIQREEFTYVKTHIAPTPQDNIVFILDESVRGDYLLINNPELNTTPLLQKYLNDYPEKFFNYGLMISIATNTFLSRSSILTALNQIPDEKFRAFSNPTLFDIAKANGYRTVMIALQAGYPDFIIRQSDLNRVDEMYIPKMGWNDFNIDFTEADKLRKLLIENKGLFIYLIKIGVHSPYQIRYPADNEHKIFTPALDLYEQVELSKRQKVVNTYKNAIHYNIDGFFKHLLGDNPKELKDCTIIYTSDHADCLFEYGVCGHFANALIEQNIVPFLIFSTDSWVLENLKRPDEIPFTLHHMNIAPTIQSILCKDLNYHSGDYSSLVSVEDFKKPPLVYISKGTVWDGEISSPVSVDENGKIILPVEKYMY